MAKLIVSDSISNVNTGASPLTLEGVAVDGSTAVAVVVDAPAHLGTSGAKLVSFRNAGTEVASIDKDGNLSSALGGITTIGTTTTAQANAASITGGNTLHISVADSTHPGAVSTAAQVFAGTKSTTGAQLVAGSGTSFPVIIGADTTAAVAGAWFGVNLGSQSVFNYSIFGSGNQTVINSSTGPTLFRINNANVGAISAASLDLSAGPAALKLSYTDSTGSPGNATINKPAGKSAIAIGAASVTISNSLVAATDIVLITPIGRDATAVSLEATPGSTAFTVTAAANATAATLFSWVVIKTA